MHMFWELTFLEANSHVPNPQIFTILCKLSTEIRGQVVDTLASYSKRRELKSRPKYQLFNMIFVVIPQMMIRSIEINYQPDATISQFVFLTFIYSSTCFGRSPAHHQELNDCSNSLWFYLRTQHDYHHDTKVKPEAATAVIELLMMGGRTPETCWAVNKR